MNINKHDRSGAVTLSAAKGLSMGGEMLRFAQHDNVGFGRETS
jgi:hypothetical protein